ncbi:MAG TPA: DUF4012 domain-containing protein [Candidatus Acidoferrales bacterium]|nr:DUF4012 domain-containing protein [Candidatus Acidoferrales bacterium]
MEQKRPILITSEEVEQLPILIVDKKGIIGTGLAKVLRDQFLVVIVTAHDVEKHGNVIHVPYHRKIPMIPDNAYSHIIIIYNGETELMDMLPAFEQKAEAVKSRFLFITSLLYSSKKLLARLQQPEFSYLQIVLYGETFNNAITEANEVNFYIHQARVYGRIEVPKEGLGKLYPIFFDDVLTSIVSLAFAVERPKRPVFLFPHHTYTQVTVARIIQTIDPMVKVDYSKKESDEHAFYIPTDGLYFFRDYNLEERLRKIDFSRVGHRAKLPQKKIRLKLPYAKIHKNRLNNLIAIFIAVFIAPLVLAFLCALLGAGMITLSVRQVEQGNLPFATTSSSIAQYSFATAQVLGPSLLLPQLIVPQLKSQFVATMQTGETIAMSEVSILQAAQTLKDIYEGKSANPQNDFLHALATMKNTLLTLQQLEAENKLPHMVQDKLQRFDGSINLIEETIDTWPNILGFEGKKTYLVLFQNNMELRPGGGFIGSYGILPVDNGKIGKLQIHDVYDADGQLTEHIQPPYGLQRYLGASHWFLRDSNFDPDFTRDAVQEEFFLKKETKQKVDGVIAIDTTFLKDLIALVGPVVVPDYNVTVTSDNFYLLTETNAEKNFFPGSTQKKDFLRSLSNALLNKLSSDKQVSYEKFAQMIVNSVMQKDLLFGFTDTGVQNVFTVNDLSSSLWDDRQAEKSTTYDFLGVVDANVGANKANYYVKRSLSHSVTIDDFGGLQATVKATYENTSTKTSSFGGDYKDYVRFIVPGNATLESVAFDNKTVQLSPAVTDPSVFTLPDFTPPPGLEVEQTQEFDKKVIGFFFIDPIGTTRTVTLLYSVPGDVENSAVVFNYNLKIFKEPGSGNDPYQLTLLYPNDTTVVDNDKSLTNVGGKMLYDEQLTSDKDLTASFSKK